MEPLIIYKEKIITSTDFEKSSELNLPLKYFAESNVVYGSGDGEYLNSWSNATFEDGYQSFPTTKITIPTDGYSVDIKPLPPIKSLNQLKKESEFSDAYPYMEFYLKDVKKYGNIANRFINESLGVREVRKFDVDMDGKEETIITLCTYGANGCPHKFIIIKDNSIIFSVEVEGRHLNLISSETGSGFYVHWIPKEKEGTKWENSYCCPPGYMKTRFVFEKGKFIPVYEQEVLYFTVNNKK